MALRQACFARRHSCVCVFHRSCYASDLRNHFVSGHEAQRHRVHAIAQAGRFRTVVEHVTEMRVAQGAAHLGARHAEHAILDLAHVLRRDGLPETRPAGAGIVFGAGIEQRVVATYAAIQARLMPVVTRLGKRRLRALLARHLVGQGRQALFPLGVFAHFGQGDAPQRLAIVGELHDGHLIGNGWRPGKRSRRIGQTDSG